jgi:hypothetical protein
MRFELRSELGVIPELFVHCLHQNVHPLKLSVPFLTRMGVADSIVLTFYFNLSAGSISPQQEKHTKRDIVYMKLLECRGEHPSKGTAATTFKSGWCCSGRKEKPCATTNKPVGSLPGWEHGCSECGVPRQPLLIEVLVIHFAC